MREGRAAPTVGLGLWMAARRPAVRVTLVLAVVGALLLALAPALVDGEDALLVPTAAAILLAWSVGVTMAVAGALHALRDDVADGITLLLRLRGASSWAHRRARVSGLALLVVLGVGGGTLLAGLATLAAAPSPTRAALATAAGVVYASAFSVTVTPLAMVTLGRGGRARGYLLFLGILVVPELLAPVTASWLPAGWDELTSIPAALDAVQRGVLAPGPAGAHAARAATVLAAVAVASMAWLRVEPDGWRP